MERRYASHPNEVKQFDTERLRKEFHIPVLFTPDKLELVLTHEDRMIVGGAAPVREQVKLETDLKELGVSSFLERRELGIINIGGHGTVLVDGAEHELNNKECLYVGMGTEEVIFKSTDPTHPAKFYLNSAPAHQSFPTAKATLEEVQPPLLVGLHVELGGQPPLAELGDQARGAGRGQLAREGRVPHLRLGRTLRFRAEAIDEWLREQERGHGARGKPEVAR